MVEGKKPKRNGGSHWCRPERRLALYLRDGLACAYCGEGVEEEARLTLDHLRPYAAGGSHDSGNLVTACLRWNSARGKRSVASFARQVAGYINHGATAEAILAHIARTRSRVVDVGAAKELIARRGSFAAALRS